MDFISKRGPMVLYDDTIILVGVGTDIEIIDVYKLSVDQTSTLDSLNRQIAEISVQIDSLNTLMLTDSLNSSNYKILKSALLEQVGDIQEKRYEETAAINNQVRSRWEKALISVNRLVAETIFESTQKRYWQLMIKEKLYGIEGFSYNEILDLLDISLLCPMEAGQSVYGARNLYRKIDNSLMFDDNEICQLEKYLPVALNNDYAHSSEKIKVDVYPNPTSYDWTIELTNPEKIRVIVELVDLKGVIFRILDFGKGSVINEKIQIDADSGVFFAKVYTGNVLVSTKKLIKLK